MKVSKIKRLKVEMNYMLGKSYEDSWPTAQDKESLSGTLPPLSRTQEPNFDNVRVEFYWSESENFSLIPIFTDRVPSTTDGKVLFSPVSVCSQGGGVPQGT